MSCISSSIILRVPRCYPGADTSYYLCDPSGSFSWLPARGHPEGALRRPKDLNIALYDILRGACPEEHQQSLFASLRAEGLRMRVRGRNFPTPHLCCLFQSCSLTWGKVPDISHFLFFIRVFLQFGQLPGFSWVAPHLGHS